MKKTAQRIGRHRGVEILHYPVSGQWGTGYGLPKEARPRGQRAITRKTHAGLIAAIDKALGFC